MNMIYSYDFDSNFPFCNYPVTSFGSCTWKGLIRYIIESIVGKKTTLICSSYIDKWPGRAGVDNIAIYFIRGEVSFVSLYWMINSQLHFLLFNNNPLTNYIISTVCQKYFKMNQWTKFADSRQWLMKIIASCPSHQIIHHFIKIRTRGFFFFSFQIR